MTLYISASKLSRELTLADRLGENPNTRERHQTSDGSIILDRGYAELARDIPELAQYLPLNQLITNRENLKQAQSAIDSYLMGGRDSDLSQLRTLLIQTIQKDADLQMVDPDIVTQRPGLNAPISLRELTEINLSLLPGVYAIA